MSTSIALNLHSFSTLDLTPAQAVLAPLLPNLDPVHQDINLRFEIDYPREPADPRELSEIPEVRLWFIRLDAHYPWLPLVLDWEAGELGRYAAMLVPHQFSPREGIRYNPEALEIFVMQKVFVISLWLQDQGLEGRSKLKFMTQMLGYELEDAFFEVLA
ncbi:MAG: CRR6 family NdhI maturation factor [Leptolyngbyaceae cyanobacterium SL_1_1]|nr:CRR6 family NdhI maturation factor [Leptolyngbyaceae cyanobacterium RM1_1_2]NJO09494.1 CRR6 family NdhI maturation factor [Leptolyngbyaceae cyanobacterium SL_1_1]